TDTSCPHCSLPLKRQGLLQKLLALFSSSGKPALRVTKTVTVKELNIVTNEQGERHEYHSLEEVPPELRTAVQNALNSTASERTLKTYKIRDASGQERTYHSLEEVPSEFRALIERAQDTSKNP